ncbi:MAG: DUF2752 domain-containing protein [Opitutaceae bacterium]
MSLTKSWKTPRILAWLGLCGVVGALFLAWGLGTSPPRWYPACVFHEMTRLHCPGCGAARALHAALHGEWRETLETNVLLVVCAPFLAAWAVRAWWQGVWRDQAPAAPPTGIAMLSLWVVLAFGIARNLPWQPFAWLAPGP